MEQKSSKWNKIDYLIESIKQQIDKASCSIDAYEAYNYAEMALDDIVKLQSEVKQLADFCANAADAQTP